MKKKLNFVIVAAVALLGVYLSDTDLNVANQQTQSAKYDDALEQAITNRQSDVQVSGEGVVSRVLSDDLEGSRHQKFILRLPSGNTVLVAHNIDLANRLDNLKKGDRVEFYGEFEWNSRGGVIHWTHRDPAGPHPHGWLRYQGKLYQ